jgi:hypothetical protein
MATASAARADDRWVADVSARVTAELRRRIEAMRAAGQDPAALGSPADLAERMVAAVPQPSPWRDLGPFYTTRAVCQLLGGVTRQAVEDRRRRRRILALRTADGTWVYPAFQFGADNRVLPGLPDVLAALAQARVSEWTVASMLTTPQPALGGRSIVEHLRAERPIEPVLELCRAAAPELAG